MKKNNMTQEEKELLLKDLSARLLYHPILNWKFLDNISRDEELNDLSDLNIWWITQSKDCEAKPYLRPMSAMTEEEYKEWCYLYLPLPHDNEATETQRRIDWLNKKNFDYRGLIPMGLALEAPENMYK